MSSCNLTHCFYCILYHDRWLGEEKIAKKLTVGFESFKVINQPKTDVNLRFSTCNMQKLASKLEPNEQEDFLLLWKPVGNSSTPTAAAAAAALVPGAAPRYSFQAPAAECKAAAAGLDADLADLALDHDVQGSDQGSVIKAGQLLSVSSSGSCSITSSRRGSSMLSDSDGPASGSSSDVEHASDLEDSSSSDGSSDKPQQHRGAQLGPEQLMELAHMKSVPIRWMDFHINLGAFLYVTLFRKPVPKQLMPVTDEQTLSWLKIKPEEAWVRHQFRHYK